MSDVSVPSIDVATPERVSVELPVAGIGFRALAYAIDVGMLFGSTIVLYFLYSLIGPSALDVFNGLTSLERAAGLLFIFLVIWGYWTGLEVLWRGQTLGKRIMRIRVVRFDGSPVGPFESAVRNLLRLVDFLPGCYPIGVMTMLIDRRHRRLGDILAGTILVREEDFDLSRYEKAPTQSARTLPAGELEVVTSFLSRLSSLDADARVRVGRQLCAKYGAADATGFDEAAVKAFLESFGSGDQPGGINPFVIKRVADWRQLEALLVGLRSRSVTLADVSTVDRLYRRASADLAHAQAFFGGTDVHRYLNQLCGQAYGAIYQRAGAGLTGLVTFYRQTFPAVARQTLGYTKVAAALLVLGTILGATTVWLSPGGADLILDPMLLDHIRRRELWTDQLLEQLHPAEVAIAIFTNNLRVSFLAFAAGITAATGTVLLLVFNGLNIGAILACCAQNDVAGTMLSFMSAHGPVELSIIAMTGGAGLMIGHAMIEPGERPRGVVLRERATKAVQLVLGCSPFLVGIGIVEGFVSPGAFFPWPLKLLLGVATGFAFWRYLLRGGLPR
ncbi:MAG: stage II sporulation protein M [Myxococcales bacterium]|nr:stage II sporulation protein M [Myxococcales bacterium]